MAYWSDDCRQSIDRMAVTSIYHKKSDSLSYCLFAFEILFKSVAIQHLCDNLCYHTPIHLLITHYPKTRTCLFIHSCHVKIHFLRTKKRKFISSTICRIYFRKSNNKFLDKPPPAVPSRLLVRLS